MPVLYSPLGVSRPFDPADRYTSSWLLPPVILAVVRLFLSLWAFTTIVVIFGWDGSHGLEQHARRSFSYFTNLTYWGLAFYFLFAGLHSLSYARSGTSWLRSWPRPLQAAHAILYTTVITFPFLVTVVFWAVLYSGHWFPVVFNAWSNISQHALNSVLALFEVLIPRTDPPPLLHLLFLIVILALYLALAYITVAAQGFYTYSFLDPGRGKGRVVGYTFGILVAICVIYGLVWGMIWTRRWVTETAWGMSGVLSPKARREDEDMELAEELK
ncbi:hypothetical protein MMC07_009360 [Pseudocyphellaria aurata]|nr:hypothetical protein [Pseudocyphellaria aurata]